MNETNVVIYLHNETVKLFELSKYIHSKPGQYDSFSVKSLSFLFLSPAIFNLIFHFMLNITHLKNINKNSDSKIDLGLYELVS